MVNAVKRLPDGWTLYTLDEVSEIILGQSPSSESYNTNGLGLPFYQGKAEFGDLYPTTVKWCSAPKKIAEAGDIFISVRAPVGPTNLCQETSAIGRGLASLRPKNGMPSKYLLYYLRLIEKEWDSKATGTTFKAITGDVLRKQEIPLAPLPEQERIVARIEELFTQLDAGTSALEKVQAGLRRYKASVLKAAVEGRLGIRNDEGRMENGGLPDGWRWAKVEELAADEKYSLAIGPFGSNLKVVDYRDEGIPLVFVRHIRTSNFDETHYVTEEKAEELKAHQIAGGDVLITKMGEPPGDACLYPESKPIAVITADCIKWRVAENLADKKYIVYAINSSVMQKQIKTITRGVAQKKVSLDRFRGLSVPLPPLEEQRQIVAEVERRLSVAREVESAVGGALIRASRLRQAVLRSAFEGETSLVNSVGVSRMGQPL